MVIIFILNNFFNIIGKSILSMATLYTLTKIMGKKQIAQLNMFDYILGITIGSIAAEFSLRTEVKTSEGVTALIVWAAVPLLVSFLNLKSIKLRSLTEGSPTILIENGKIIEKNLKKVRFTVNDLLEELRVKGNFNIYDIKYAILETNGQISVAEKNKPFYINLVIDGKVIDKNLKLLNISREWLNIELQKNNIIELKDVFFLSIDENKNLFIDKREESEKKIEL